MKNFNSEKKGISEFLKNKGFYIVLILCIAVIGVTAVMVTTYNITSSKNEFDTQKIIPDEVAGSVESVDKKVVAQSSVDTSSMVQAQKSTTTAVDTNKPAAPASTKQESTQKQSVNTPASAKPAENKKEETAKTQNFILPVSGEVTFEYSQDKLLYSKTLEEWRVHTGVDFGAEKGTPVKAAADGVVTEVKNDPRFGIMAVVEHQNGTKTVYGNLASAEMVTPNQKVKQGDIIGSIGNTASFEANEQTHLHFEVFKNNEPVNPMTYLPKK